MIEHTLLYIMVLMGFACLASCNFEDKDVQYCQWTVSSMKKKKHMDMEGMLTQKQIMEVVNRSEVTSIICQDDKRFD